MHPQMREFASEIRAFEEDGMIEVYATTYGNKYPIWGNMYEVVEPGAFTKSLKERTKRRVFWEHMEVIGVEKSIVDDGKGLLCTGQLCLDVQRAREARSLAKMGAVDSSMRFLPMKNGWKEEEPGTYHLREAKLLEWSLVGLPANPKAALVKVRSLLEDDDPEKALMDIIAASGNPELRMDKALLTRGIDALEALMERSEPGDTTQTDDEPQPNDEEPGDDPLLRQLLTAFQKAPVVS